MFHYKAFGLQISSEIKLIQLPEIMPGEEDIYIERGIVPKNLNGEYIDYGWIQIKHREVLFHVDGVAEYYIKDGKYIIVQTVDNTEPEKSAMVQVYLMGTAMGALLIQKGILPLHGSCIWKANIPAVLFTGESGAGKSTTASWFMKNGWNMISDDVTPIQMEDDSVIAYPSFPQQKLWEDAVARQKLESNKAYFLWENEEQQKYAMRNQATFHDKQEVLGMVIQLIPKNQKEVTYREIVGLEKAILLREHTYRNFLFADNRAKQLHFQQCAELAGKLKVYHLYRPIGKESEENIFNAVKEILKGTRE